jgi:hypothetical protein
VMMMMYERILYLTVKTHDWKNIKKDCQSRSTIWDTPYVVLSSVAKHELQTSLIIICSFILLIHIWKQISVTKVVSTTHLKHPATTYNGLHFSFLQLMMTNAWPATKTHRSPPLCTYAHERTHTQREV